jgi:hypothetical protein
MMKRIVTLLCSALLLAILPAAADDWNKKTTVTFSAPVELPGVVLPAGTYVFKLLDLASERHIVRVTNVAEDKIFATILAIPNWRLTPTENTVMPFGERPRNNPEALRAWFYPGDNFGQEFVYPKRRAEELAVITHQPVLSGEVMPAEEPKELAETHVVAVTPENKEVEVAQVIPPAPARTPAPLIAQAAPPAAPAELPKTASPLPLIFLVGIGSLGFAGILRLVRHAARS